MTFSYPNHPFIIAELSGNHNGDINRAFRLIDAAKASGADAVKLQTYTADTITIDHDGSEFLVDLPLWKGRKLYDLYQEAHTPWDWHPDLFAYAQKVGITIFSSPFDETAVDLLESLGAPLYKIASFELVDIPLIAYVARLKKPMIMSTGMANLEEISEAVNAAQKAGATDITLLHCVSEYPAPYSACDLKTMVELGRHFPNVRLGLSDHTMGTVVPIAAVALGAQVIEKHITLARADGGVDSAFSLEPQELAQLCEQTKISAQCLGRVDFEKSKQSAGRKYRPSLYVVKPIKKGDVFSHDNIRTIRPANGLAPKYLEQVLGQKAKQDIDFGTPLQMEMIDK
ncbi:MAG: pseudaminic acid synthase [Alphaproteobacteria bacterium]|nr:pseudaminic acid synthase [Alphaproteobacteria bacterium]